MRPAQSSDEREERVALDALPENLAVWRWNAAADELWATERFREIIGLPAASALSKDVVLQRIHPCDREGFANLFAERVGSSAADFEFRVIMPTGHVRWIVGRAHVWREASGKLVRANGVIVDATERKLSEAEMERNRQQIAHLSRVTTIGQLSTTLAHELNQPLSSILSNAEAAQLILAQESIALDEVRAIVADIVREDLRAVEMIRRLRDMLRPRPSQVQPLDLAQVAREVLALARGELIARHVKAIIRLPQALPLACGDRVQIQQVLLNLLLNAADAMEGIGADERVVEVIADSEAGAVHLQVIDRGSGIPPGCLHQVFEAFFTTKRGGMGLGLAISRSIVAAHGGRLWATNNAGRGASFHLTLPSVGLQP